jgi:hypothetical protein
MDEPRYTRPYLESLTTGELAVLADSSGIDIPPDLERTFIIEALLDIDYDDDPSPDEALPLEEVDFTETVSLPKHYNITFIEVLLRDPLWAFTFWEIKSRDREIFEKEDDFEGYLLKVFPAGSSDGKVEKPGAEGLFTVSVGPEDSAWYLGFPPEGGCFKVVLCVQRGGETEILAVSRSFRLPKLLPSPAAVNTESHHNPLIRLSGWDDFHILRNTDRFSRLPRCGKD